MTIAAGTKYRSKHIAASFDAIIVGSGMGGLTCASLLAQDGKKVLLLEQHFTIGGCTHAFARKGYEWDIGLHYVGDVHKKSTLLWQAFDHVTAGGVEWAPLPDIYNRFVIADKTYDIPSGVVAYSNKMKEYFPQEALAIDSYIEILLSVNKMAASFFAERALPRAMGDKIYETASKDFLTYSDQTTYEVLSGLTDNQELIAVLAGNFGDYGLPPKESAFAVHAQAVKHYINGASFPVGGAPSLAASIIPIIEKAGGKALYSAEVAEILVQDGQACGVKMASGDQIKAPMVISGAGVYNTFSKMLPDAVVQDYGLAELPEKIDPSLTLMMLNIGINQSGESLGLTAANFWTHPSNDYDEDIRRYEQDQNNPMSGHLIAFPSLRDPSWNERYPNKATISMCSPVPFALFEKWQHLDAKDRGADYHALKQQITDKMFEDLYAVVPQIRGKIDYFEVATPLTIGKFLGREKGNFMGLAHSPERFRQRWLRADTPIKNLYLTGQDITSDGIVGAMSSGVITASAILQRNLWGDIMKKQNPVPSGTLRAS